MAPKQWHQKFDEVVLSKGYLLNQADKCVYIKFDKPGKRVIIYLNVNDMLIIGTDQVQVDLTKKFLSSRFSMKDMRDADIILVSTLMDTSEKIMPNNGKVVSHIEYFMVIDCLMYVITCTRLDIAFAVGKLSSGWVSFLEEGVISWASKKQTCIKSSTMESEFMALAHSGKEAEWLRNVILDIPL
nr:zinc finger, CCHC-type [Tanacetum cinerariifolium]